jgi:hypothetical protein
MPVGRRTPDPDWEGLSANNSRAVVNQMSALIEPREPKQNGLPPLYKVVFPFETVGCSLLPN